MRYVFPIETELHVSQSFTIYMTPVVNRTSYVIYFGFHFEYNFDVGKSLCILLVNYILFYY